MAFIASSGKYDGASVLGKDIAKPEEDVPNKKASTSDDSVIPGKGADDPDADDASGKALIGSDADDASGKALIDPDADDASGKALIGPDADDASGKALMDPFDDGFSGKSPVASFIASSLFEETFTAPALSAILTSTPSARTYTVISFSVGLLKVTPILNQPPFSAYISTGNPAVM